jgi:hypothetical protein
MRLRLVSARLRHRQVRVCDEPHNAIEPQASKSTIHISAALISPRTSIIKIHENRPRMPEIHLKAKRFLLFLYRKAIKKQFAVWIEE